MATNFLLIVTALVPVLMLGVALLMFALRRQKIAAICAGATLAHQSVLIAYPIVHGVFTGFEQEKTMAIYVGPPDLLRVMIMESVFVTLFVAALLIPFRRRGHAPRAAAVPSYNWFVGFLAICGAILYVHSALQPLPQYEESIHHADIVVRTLTDSIFQWMRGILSIPTLIAAAVVMGDKKYPFWLRMTGLGTIGVLIFIGLSAGLRGRITWAISLLVIAAVFERRWRFLAIAALVVIPFIPISSFMAGAFRSITFRASSRVEAVRALKDYALSDDPAKDWDMPFATSLARRAQGPRNSVVLLRLRDFGEGAGIRPLLGAVVLPVPRLIWPSKPPAGSSTDDNYGAAIYVVRRIGYNSPVSNMGPALPSAHAYWEGGWLWVIFGGLATGLCWNLLLRIFGGPPATHLGLVLAFTYAGAQLIDGLFTMLNPLYALISVTWSSVLPCLAILGMFRMFLGTLRWLMPSGRTAPARPSHATTTT